jgi:dihydroxyacetone kinase
LELADIVLMFQAAEASLVKKGGARVGDKTLLDALVPAVAALEQSAAAGEDLGQAFQAAAAAAAQGAEKTKSMVARRGRASYVGERSLNHPDAGAMAVAIILKSLTK